MNKENSKGRIIVVLSLMAALLTPGLALAGAQAAPLSTAELKQVIDDPSVEIVADKAFRKPNESPADTELFRVVEGVLARRYPGVPVTTKLLTGGTECVLFRSPTLACYGFTPLLPLREEAGTEHGDDERINEATLRESAGVFYDVVRDLVKRR